MSQSIIPATVMIMTRNEEGHIAAAIQSVKDFSQIIVIDSNSSDQTAKIAKNNGAEVVHFDWNGRYPKKRQWSLENCDIKNDWVVFLDADERMTSQLVKDIHGIAQNNTSDSVAYYVSGQPVWNGKPLKYGRWHQKIIVFKKDHIYYPDFADILAPEMGEIEGHYQPRVNGKINYLSGHIIHDCARDVDEWKDKHIGYAKWHAWMLKHHGAAKLSGNSRGLRGLIKYLFYKLPLNAVMAWVDTVIFKFGFLDGRAGLSYGVARAWYYNQITKQRRQL